MPLAHVIMLDERLRQQQLAVGAIEDVEEAVAVGVQHQLARLALPVRVDQHRRLRRVPVPQIVRRELVVPLQLAVGALQREDAAGIEVVPLAIVAVVFLRRVAGRPVDDVELADRSCR